MFRLWSVSASMKYDRFASVKPIPLSETSNVSIGYLSIASPWIFLYASSSPFLIILILIFASSAANNFASIASLIE